MTIPSEGSNIDYDFDFNGSLYIETKTSSVANKNGASHRPYRAKEVGMISTQSGTSKLGAHVVPYRPELMAILMEGL